jgi:hypothetical protein
VYDASDPTFPPIGTVVTLASPHQGSTLARATVDLRNSITNFGPRALDPIEHFFPVPPSTSPAVRQLAEGSPTMRTLWRHGLPDHIDFTSIGGNDDVVVPANRIHVPGGTEATVTVAGIDDHGAVHRDPTALRAVRTALEGRPPPCTSVLEGLRSAIEPVLIDRLESELSGLAVGLAGGTR